MALLTINGYVIKFSNAAYPGVPATVELRVMPTVTKVLDSAQITYMDRDDITLELDLGVTMQVLKFPSSDGSQLNTSSPPPAVELSTILDALTGAVQASPALLRTKCYTAINNLLLGAGVATGSATLVTEDIISAITNILYVKEK